ncbi:MAG: hypothetical protein GTN98_09495 [Woeseiaceae bacterium]|nr:hypothetical protein [Woeseiaceae bacterium]
MNTPVPEMLAITIAVSVGKPNLSLDIGLASLIMVSVTSICLAPMGVAADYPYAYALLVWISASRGGVS